jgi:hypothetical protein
MNSMNLNQLGIEGPDDAKYFQKQLNRITIEGSEDYRLVLFFIKKGARMPLHDHPNMCVFFRMLFGKLNYKSYDKIDEKFKYNQFSLDEYQEMLERKQSISAKLVNKTVLHGPQFLMVRPSRNNLHEFVAEENTCFFDICLPNYTADSLRRITYFKEQEGIFDPVGTIDKTMESSTKTSSNLIRMAFDSTPPVLP